MASTKTLTPHDNFILTKLSDPEASPSPLLLDSSLPPDPHITSPTTYKELVSTELAIISNLQKAEFSLGPSPTPSQTQTALTTYLSAIESLSTIIEKFPSYASARNNRAQALRRVYGDGTLVSNPSQPNPSTNNLTLSSPTSTPESTLLTASTIILNDLALCISLLTPKTPFSPLSPQTAKTLSQAYTQRGAVYHFTSKALSAPGAGLRIASERKEKDWSVLQFEEAASRDFMWGGRLGNEVARGLGVVTNPTAKLCGDMVREAIRREVVGEK